MLPGMTGPQVDAPSGPMPTREFFSGMLPAIIAERAELFDRTDGSVCVMIHEVGQWTVRFGDHAAANAVSDEADFDADLVLTWTDAQFQSLLSGQAADTEALEPVFIGDISLLEKFGTLLVPPAKGGLGARMWGI